MKILVFVLFTFLTFNLFAQDKTITVEAAKKVRDLVCAQISGVDDPTSIFNDISEGKHPYKDKDNSELYAFVYDKDVNIVAHPTKGLKGTSQKGKGDINGIKFRDDMVQKGLDPSNTVESVEYTYQKPGESGFHKKEAYFKGCKTKKGETYIVAVGRYKD